MKCRKAVTLSTSVYSFLWTLSPESGPTGQDSPPRPAPSTRRGLVVASSWQKQLWKVVSGGKKDTYVLRPPSWTRIPKLCSLLSSHHVSLLGGVCLQGCDNLSQFTRLYLEIKTPRLLNMGTIGFAGGRGFMPLEKAGWGGEFEVSAWGPKQRSDSALLTSCQVTAGSLERAVTLLGGLLGADWNWLSVCHKFPSPVWLQDLAWVT